MQPFLVQLLHYELVVMQCNALLNVLSRVHGVIPGQQAIRRGLLLIPRG